MQIEIVNWDKFNPRKDLRSMPWVRLQNDIAFEPKLFGLTAEQKWVWIFLLSYGARENKGKFSLELSYISHYCGVSEEALQIALLHFQSNQMITILTNGSDRITNGSVRARKVTRKVTNGSVSNERNGTNVTERNETDGTNDSLSELAPPTPDELTPRKFFDLWNANRGTLAEVEKLTKARTRKIELRLKEEPSRAYWEDVFRRLAASDHATGKTRSERFPNGWRATFEWLIDNDNNHVKAREGKYDNRKSASRPARGFEREENPDDELAAMAEGGGSDEAAPT